MGIRLNPGPAEETIQGEGALVPWPSQSVDTVHLPVPHAEGDTSMGRSTFCSLCSFPTPLCPAGVGRVQQL